MTHRNFLRLLLVLGTAALAFVAVAAVIAAHYGSAPGTSSGEISGIGGASVPTPGYVATSRSAPAFSLPSLDGSGRVTAASGHGPVAVNFWASDCAPCRREAPVLATAARALTGRVAFIGIDTVDLAGPARALVRRDGLGYPIGSDPTESVGNRFGLDALPTTYFLSPDRKRIVGIYFGAMTAAELAGALEHAYGLRISAGDLTGASRETSR